jgi:hypothetical protein
MRLTELHGASADKDKHGLFVYIDDICIITSAPAADMVAREAARILLV